MEQELNELKSESTTLRETLQVLHVEKAETDKKVRSYEKHYGVEGLSKMITGITEMIETNEQIDLMKGKSLMEMTAIVTQLSNKIEELKTTIQPLAQEHKNLKGIMAQLEPQYKEEKAVFDGVVADAKTGLDKAREKYMTVKTEVYDMDSKIDILNHQIRVVKIMNDM